MHAVVATSRTTRHDLSCSVGPTAAGARMAWYAGDRYNVSRIRLLLLNIFGFNSFMHIPLCKQTSLSNRNSPSKGSRIIQQFHKLVKSKAAKPRSSIYVGTHEVKFLPCSIASSDQPQPFSWLEEV